jgi:hypothetical protein
MVFYFRLMVVLVVLALVPVYSSDTKATATCVIDPFQENPVLPTTLLSDLQCKSEISLVATQGEYEAGSFVVRTDNRMSDVEFIATDLVGDKGRIPRNNVRIQYVKAWYQAAGSVNPVKRDGTTRVLVPELLLNDDDLVKVDISGSRNFLRMSDGQYVDSSVEADLTGMVQHRLDKFSVRDSVELMPTTLHAGQTRQIWLTVLVPENAVPGEYSGSVQVLRGGVPVLHEVPIYVRVPGFKLSPPSLEYSIYYRGQLDPSGRGSISSEEKSEVQFVAELRNMAAHGVSNPTVYQQQGGIRAFQKVLEFRAQEGLSNASIFQVGIYTGSFSSPMRYGSGEGRFKALQEMAKSQGVKDLYVYCVDEGSSAEIRAQRDVWRQVKSIGGKLFAAAYRYGSAEKEYAGNIDVLVLGIPVDPNVVSFFQSAGTRVYMYNQPQVGVESPAIYRVNYGVRAWQAGFDGVMNYAYQHSMGSIWNDSDHYRFKDHVFAYPTINGVIDTIAWEGFREAVDDVRYISTLVEIAGNDESGRAKAVIGKIKRNVLAPEMVREEVEDALSAFCQPSTGAVRNSEVCIR